ncbi:MAG: DUF4097 family beta strand repeat-containing protein [Chloroflexota bacterium]
MPQERVTGRLIERSYEVGPSAEVHVNNVRGAVRITGTESTTVQLRIEVDPDHRVSDEDIERLPLDLEQEGSRVNVKVLSDKAIMGWFERRSGPPAVRISLEVPLPTVTNTSCVSADVSIAGLTGVQTANTVSGKVAATDIDGDLRLNTVSGDALITRSNGAVRWNSVSGDLIVREGDTTGITANSVSGGTEATLNGAMAAGAQAQTVSGNLKLTVPANFGCDAQLSSMSGSVQCALPVQVLESKRGRWHATVNGGGPTVRLSSMSGSLLLLNNSPDGARVESFRPGQGAAGGDFRPQAPQRPDQQRPTDQPADERLRILRQVERKEISIEEGLARLDAMRRQTAGTERDN